MGTKIKINNLPAGLEKLIAAYNFAAQKHQKQRRKGTGEIPYINHPIEVVNLLAQTVGAENTELLVAAVLHDTLEDTNTTFDELKSIFGSEVALIVKEVSDDKGLSKEKRKEIQVQTASELSDNAKLIKIADKRCNILNMLTTRYHWTKRQKINYVLWANEVVSQCRGINAILDAEFDIALKRAKNILGIS